MMISSRGFRQRVAVMGAMVRARGAASTGAGPGPDLRVSPGAPAAVPCHHGEVAHQGRLRWTYAVVAAAWLAALASLAGSFMLDSWLRSDGYGHLTASYVDISVILSA